MTQEIDAYAPILTQHLIHLENAIASGSDARPYRDTRGTADFELCAEVLLDAGNAAGNLSRGTDTDLSLFPGNNRVVCGAAHNMRAIEGNPGASGYSQAVARYLVCVLGCDRLHILVTEQQLDDDGPSEDIEVLGSSSADRVPTSSVNKEAFSVKLASRPTAASFSPSGDLLVVGDIAGKIHFVLSSGKLLFSQEIFYGSSDQNGKHRAEPTEFASLAGTCPDDAATNEGHGVQSISFLRPPALEAAQVSAFPLLVVGSGGQVLLLDGLRPQAIVYAATTGDVGRLRALKAQVRVSSIKDELEYTMFGEKSGESSIEADFVWTAAHGACILTQSNRQVVQGATTEAPVADSSEGNTVSLIRFLEASGALGELDMSRSGDASHHDVGIGLGLGLGVDSSDEDHSSGSKSLALASTQVGMSPAVHSLSTFSRFSLLATARGPLCRTVQVDSTGQSVLGVTFDGRVVIFKLGVASSCEISSSGSFEAYCPPAGHSVTMAAWGCGDLVVSTKPSLHDVETPQVLAIVRGPDEQSHALLALGRKSETRGSRPIVAYASTPVPRVSDQGGGAFVEQIPLGVFSDSNETFDIGCVRLVCLANSSFDAADGTGGDGAERSTLVVSCVSETDAVARLEYLAGLDLIPAELHAELISTRAPPIISYSEASVGQRAATWAISAGIDELDACRARATVSARCITLYTLAKLRGDRIDKLPTMEDLAAELDSLSVDSNFVSEVCASAVGHRRDDVTNILNYAIASCEYEGAVGVEDGGLAFTLDIVSRWKAFNAVFNTTPFESPVEFDAIVWWRWSQATLPDILADIAAIGKLHQLEAFWRLCGSAALAAESASRIVLWPKHAILDDAWLLWFKGSIQDHVQSKHVPALVSWLAERALGCLKEDQVAHALLALGIAVEMQPHYSSKREPSRTACMDLVRVVYTQAGTVDDLYSGGKSIDIDSYEKSTFLGGKLVDEECDEALPPEQICAQIDMELSSRLHQTLSPTLYQLYKIVAELYWLRSEADTECTVAELSLSTVSGIGVELIQVNLERADVDALRTARAWCDRHQCGFAEILTQFVQEVARLGPHGSETELISHDKPGSNSVRELFENPMSQAWRALFRSCVTRKERQAFMQAVFTYLPVSVASHIASRNSDIWIGSHDTSLMQDTPDAAGTATFLHTYFILSHSVGKQFTPLQLYGWSVRLRSDPQAAVAILRAVIAALSARSALSDIGIRQKLGKIASGIQMHSHDWDTPVFSTLKSQPAAKFAASNVTRVDCDRFLFSAVAARYRRKSPGVNLEVGGSANLRDAFGGGSIARHVTATDSVVVSKLYFLHGITDRVVDRHVPQHVFRSYFAIRREDCASSVPGLDPYKLKPLAAGKSYCNDLFGSLRFGRFTTNRADASIMSVANTISSLCAASYNADGTGIGQRMRSAACEADVLYLTEIGEYGSSLMSLGTRNKPHKARDGKPLSSKFFGGKRVGTGGRPTNGSVTQLASQEVLNCSTRDTSSVASSQYKSLVRRYRPGALVLPSKFALTLLEEDFDRPASGQVNRTARVESMRIYLSEQLTEHGAILQSMRFAVDDALGVRSYVVSDDLADTPLHCRMLVVCEHMMQDSHRFSSPAPFVAAMLQFKGAGGVSHYHEDVFDIAEAVSNHMPGIMYLGSSLLYAYFESTVKFADVSSAQRISAANRLARWVPRLQAIGVAKTERLEAGIEMAGSFMDAEPPASVSSRELESIFAGTRYRLTAATLYLQAASAVSLHEYMQAYVNTLLAGSEAQSRRIEEWRYLVSYGTSNLADQDLVAVLGSQLPMIASDDYARLSFSMGSVHELKPRDYQIRKALAVARLALSIRPLRQVTAMSYKTLLRPHVESLASFIQYDTLGNAVGNPEVPKSHNMEHQSAGCVEAICELLSGAFPDSHVAADGDAAEVAHVVHQEVHNALLPLPLLLAEALETLVPQLTPGGIAQLLPVAGMLGIDPDELHAALAVRMCRFVVVQRVLDAYVNAFLLSINEISDDLSSVAVRDRACCIELLQSVARISSDAPGLSTSIGFGDIWSVLSGIQDKDYLLEACATCCREVPSDYADLAEVCPGVYDAANALRVFGMMVVDGWYARHEISTYRGASTADAGKRLDDDALPQLDDAFLTWGKSSGGDTVVSSLAEAGGNAAVTGSGEKHATVSLDDPKDVQTAAVRGYAYIVRGLPEGEIDNSITSYARVRDSLAEIRRSLAEGFDRSLGAHGELQGLLPLRMALSVVSYSTALKALHNYAGATPIDGLGAIGDASGDIITVLKSSLKSHASQLNVLITKVEIGCFGNALYTRLAKDLGDLWSLVVLQDREAGGHQDDDTEVGGLAASDSSHTTAAHSDSVASAPSRLSGKLSASSLLRSLICIMAPRYASHASRMTLRGPGMELHHVVCSIAHRHGVDLQRLSMYAANDILNSDAIDRWMVHSGNSSAGISDTEAELKLEHELAWLLSRPRESPPKSLDVYGALSRPEACYRALLKVAFAPEVDSAKAVRQSRPPSGEVASARPSTPSPSMRARALRVALRVASQLELHAACPGGFGGLIRRLLACTHVARLLDVGNGPSDTAVDGTGGSTMGLRRARGRASNAATSSTPWEHATTIEHFLTSDKSSLARGLWRDLRGDRLAVREVISLALDYGAGDRALLESALQQAFVLGEDYFLLDACVCMHELLAANDVALPSTFSQLHRLGVIDAGSREAYGTGVAWLGSPANVLALAHQKAGDGDGKRDFKDDSSSSRVAASPYACLPLLSMQRAAILEGNAAVESLFTGTVTRNLRKAMGFIKEELDAMRRNGNSWDDLLVAARRSRATLLVHRTGGVSGVGSGASRGAPVPGYQVSVRVQQAITLVPDLLRCMSTRFVDPGDVALLAAAHALLVVVLDTTSDRHRGEGYSVDVLEPRCEKEEVFELSTLLRRLRKAFVHPCMAL